MLLFETADFMAVISSTSGIGLCVTVTEKLVVSAASFNHYVILLLVRLEKPAVS